MDFRVDASGIGVIGLGRGAKVGGEVVQGRTMRD